MEQAVHVFIYAGLLVFVLAVAARIVYWIKMPIHLRWELYPVAHEPERASYGGSYLEESDWWTKKRHTSLLGELKVMVPEILFLVALKEHNPKMWRRSFPFHFGLYLIIGAALSMILFGLLANWLPAAAGGWFGDLVYWVGRICATVGLVLVLLGAGGLLHRRLSTPELRMYSTRSDIFNLVFFLLAFSVAFAHFLAVDRDFSRVFALWSSLVSFSFQPLSGTPLEAGWLALAAVLLTAMVAYIPLTHMSHFIGKYFAYHSIRWNDRPNLPGSREEKQVLAQLNRPVSWNAPHIRGGGRTWAQVAMENPAAEDKK